MVWWVAAIVCCLDQLTKLWAVHTLASGRTITVVDNFLRLAYAENQGGAAGIMRNHPQVLTLFSLAALVVIIWWARSIPAEDRVARLGFGAVLGGALGNLIDRLFRGGFIFGTYVVDFIDAHWYDKLHWPTFNLADSAICIGIGLIILANIRSHRHAAARLGGEKASSPAVARKTGVSSETSD